MYRSITIANDGSVAAISIIPNEYYYSCPDFITFENFTRMKCINIDDHMNPDSWVEIEEPQPI